MSQTPHVVVVGAGIIGASIAWHLVASGARVTVLDAREPGGVATAASFAWINAGAGNPKAYFRLRHRAMQEWRRLAVDLPDLPVSWTGGLAWDMAAEDLRAYAGQHGGWGYSIREVDAAEARRIEPNLAAPPAYALHVAEEAAAEPRDVALALLKDAEARGASVMPHTSVKRLIGKAGRVTGIETDVSVHAADEVVLATGAGTPALLAGIGLDFPMTTPPGLLVHSRPHAPLLNGLVLSPGLHMRQTRAGRIVSGSGFAGADPGADPAGVARALFARAKTMLAGAGDLAFESFTIGYRPTPAGGFPMVGRIDDRPGLFVAVMHSGVTLAPLIGRFVAQDVLTGRRDPLLEGFGPQVGMMASATG